MATPYCFTTDEERLTKGMTVQVTDWLAPRMKANREVLDHAIADLARVPHCIVQRADGRAAVFRVTKLMTPTPPSVSDRRFHLQEQEQREGIVAGLGDFFGGSNGERLFVSDAGHLWKRAETEDVWTRLL